MMIWEVQRQMVQLGTKNDKEALVGWLADGWEPFAVTWDGKNNAWDYHLRRQVDDTEVQHSDGSLEGRQVERASLRRRGTAPPGSEHQGRP